MGKLNAKALQHSRGFLYGRIEFIIFLTTSAFTASIEGPVTPYIHAVNAVDAVEPFKIDIGAAWVWGLWAVPPNCMKCVFQYMYPRSLLETSTASTA